MELCLSMIVKNESAVIRRSLRAVKPLISYYTISDTGSTDNTMEIIREELEGIPGVLTSDAWVDFATNRTIALSRAKGTHVLSLDADETVQWDGRPLQLPEEFNAFQILITMPTLKFYFPRLFKNDGKWRWEGVVHEVPTRDDAVISDRFEGISIFTRSDGNQNTDGTNKYEKYVVLLEKAPRTSRNVFYHAETLRALGRKYEAIGVYFERIALGGWEEEVYYSLWQAAELAKTFLPYESARLMLLSAHRYRPSRHEALASLCHHMRMNKDFEGSYWLSQDVTPTDDILFVDPRAEWRVLEEHALAAYYTDKKNEARKYFERILTYDLNEADRQHTLTNIAWCD